MSAAARKSAVRQSRKLKADTITLAHGSGGRAMRDLIDDVFVQTFDNDALDMREDQARFDLSKLAGDGGQLAMATDSFVVDPLFFPGGDIGKLAVAGTVNDLAVSGAIPKYLTCGMIVEEGLSVDTLRRVVASMKETADTAGVSVVTGDTKVVHRGAADKLFINTAGIGIIKKRVNISGNRAMAGDVIVTNGHIGDHGAAIVDARGEFAMVNTIQTDCQPLNGLIQQMLGVCTDIHCMRDATRGGVASVLNEFAEASGVGIRLDEESIPVRPEVRGMCEILGLDPLYLANEGKLVAIVPPGYADSLVSAMRAHPMGQYSAVIGEVTKMPAGRVVLATSFGGERVVDMLLGEQLPRIC